MPLLLNNCNLQHTNIACFIVSFSGVGQRWGVPADRGSLLAAPLAQPGECGPQGVGAGRGAAPAATTRYVTWAGQGTRSLHWIETPAHTASMWHIQVAQCL